jgi:DNA-binding winged helix-turn-helix (wHTH) protein/tetratricopeptide (TPR) repeat protein
MEGGAYRFGDFVISPGERRLYDGAASVRLPPKAFDVLCLLVRNHGNLVSRDDISHTLWSNVHVTEANLTNIIVLLRKHLGADAIQTVSKFGYRFTLPVTGEPGVDQAAYGSFIRGKEFLQERSLESIHRARDLFLLSLAQDPQFAPAWAWLGRTCRVIEKFRGDEPEKPNLADAAFQRAFSIDPDLACAHHFYTQLQVDFGHAAQAMTRLASRLKRRGEDPETLAGLVQVLRYCGLLDESVTAHEHAVALDPTIRTSVAHTFFLQCRYTDVFETYIGKGFYLDAASWAAFGQVDRAATLLRTRLTQPHLGPMMYGMMASLLAVLEGRCNDALALIEKADFTPDPEGLFYLARHCGMLNAAAPALAMVRRAREGGFCSSICLEQDHAFANIRGQAEIESEIRLQKGLEAETLKTFRQVLGNTFVLGTS